MASQFSNAGQPSDSVFVMVLVEDSRAMQAKWNDVRRHYLPLILESLRTVDMVEQVRALLHDAPHSYSHRQPSQMHIWWLTSSAASKPFTTSTQNAGYCHEIPEVKLGQQPDTAISTATIRRCLKARHFSLSCASHFWIVRTDEAALRYMQTLESNGTIISI